MKRLLYLAIAIFSIFCTSCSKEEFDDITTESVVGQWQAVKLVRTWDDGKTKIEETDRRWLKTYNDMFHFYENGKLVHWSSGFSEGTSNCIYTYSVENNKISVNIPGNSATRTETMQGYISAGKMIIKRNIKTTSETIYDTYTLVKY